MKKLFFLALTIGVCLFSAAPQASDSLLRDREAFTVAKAFKLGRGSTSLAGGPVIPGDGDELNLKDCDANCAADSCNRITGKCSKCVSGRYLYKDMCMVCPANATCGDGKTFACNSCSGGKEIVKTNKTCGCQCPSAKPVFNLAINRCVTSGCSAGCGSCKSTIGGAYCNSCKGKASLNSEGACVCPSLQVFNTTINQCVRAVCPAGCTSDCRNGCSSCESGRYLSYSDGSCPTCSSAVANCKTCTSSASGVKCTACNDEYRLENGKCVANCTGVTCQSGATAKATKTGCCCEITSCPSGQRLSNGACVANCSGVTCKSGYKAVSTSTGCCCEATKLSCSPGCVTCNTATGKCTKCDTNYTLSNGSCSKNPSSGTRTDCTKCQAGFTKNLKSCPSGQILQQGVICVNSTFTCGKCVSKTSSGGGGGGGGSLRDTNLSTTLDSFATIK